MRFVAAFVATFLAVSPALAWVADVEDEDVFGASRAAAFETNGDAILIAHCTTDGEFSLVYGNKRSDTNKISEVPARLIISTSNAEKFEFDATYRGWNSDYVGVVANLMGENRARVAELIGSANGKIKVGALVRGNKLADNFGSSGSRSAMKKIVEGCKINFTD